MLEMVDTKSNADELVKGLEMIVEYVKTFEDSTTADLTKIFAALDDFAAKLKDDADEDKKTIRTITGQAIADLRLELENRIASKEAAIDKRLSEVKDGKDGVSGKDGESIVGPAGKDGSPDTPEQVVEKVNTASSLIKQEKIEGLADILRITSSAGNSVPVTTAFYNGLRAKNLNIVGGTATQSGDTVNITVGGGGSGTVTSVSVASANGFNGSVANATTTPAITLTTTVTGLLKGNGTAISAAVSNTDYQAPIALTTTGTSGAATFDGTTLNIPQYSAGGGGDVSSNTSSSVDSEVALFSGTGGKTIKRATGTGIATLTSGVLSATAVTGSGSVVLATSPTLVTPTLGVAVATSINKVAITAPATSATITIADGKTLTVSNTLTFTGTDTSSVAFGGGGTVLYTASTIPLTVGTTTIASGTNTRILYDNSGVLGELVSTSAATASAVSQRDSNANIFFNNYLGSATATTSAGGTTVLTAASTRFQALTGSSAQTYQLPDATTLSLGPWFVFNNNSSQSLTITNAGGSTIYTVPAGGIVQVGPTSIASANGAWDTHGYFPGTVTWSSGLTGLVMNTALTTTPQILAGASSSTAPSFIPQRTASTTGFGGDGTKLYETIGGTAISATSSTGVAVTGTLSVTGHVTFESVTSTGATGTGKLVFDTSPTLVTPTLGVATATSINTITLTGVSTPALTVTGTTSVSGSNTGDQTITLTGAVTGSGTGSFATTIATPGTLTVASTNSTATAHTHAITSSSAPGAAASLLATDSSGIIGSTGTRIVKIWATDLTVTNSIAGSITGNAATVTTNANLTGVITSSGNATSIASQTGTGSKFVVDTSPTLVTPVLGVATATSINGNTFTTGTYTLTGASGKTLTFNNSITLTGTDSTTMTFPSTTATIARTDAAQTFTGTQTFSQIVTTNNAITATSNAATVPITSRISTVTNSSAATLTITITTTSAVDGQLVMVRIKDASAVAQTISWVNTENSTVTAPTTSNGSTTLPLTVGFQFNSATTKWRCIASA